MNRFRWNHDFVRADNGREICFFCPSDARGSVLRGMAAQRVREVDEELASGEFSLDDRRDHRLWADFVAALLERDLIVPVPSVASPPPVLAGHGRASVRIGLAGSAALIEHAMSTLIAAGYTTDAPSGTTRRAISAVESAGDVEACTMVALLDDKVDIGRHLELNKASLENGARFLSLRVWGTRFEIGPLVLPGGGACFSCYLDRMLASSRVDAPPAWFVRRSASKSVAPPVPIGEVLYSIAPKLLALECCRCFDETQRPTMVGRVLTHDLSTLGFTTHTVYEVPGCSACSGREVSPP